MQILKTVLIKFIIVDKKNETILCYRSIIVIRRDNLYVYMTNLRENPTFDV